MPTSQIQTLETIKLNLLKKTYFLQRDFVLDLLHLLLDEFQRGYCHMLLND